MEGWADGWVGMSGWVGGCKARTGERQVKHKGCKIYRDSFMVMQVQVMTLRVSASLNVVP